jgi:large subunit ribosomal protein L19
VERVFPVYSPHIAKIEVESSSRVRRAKLYYLRRKTGKKSRLKALTESPAAGEAEGA